jgi:ATP-dependent helicase/nuclease subunit A
LSRLSDAEARIRALDPTHSFIVQAPAGSGKTELLIQRYLRLLSGVAEPEQIVAITFTRKAAAEMRARILAAFSDAAMPAQKLSPHKQLTRDLATAALARDAERDWNIRADTQRIRIGTLDSFNTALAMHLPLLSGGAAGSEICDDAPALYAEAARRTVEAIWQEGDSQDSRAAVLAELDFDTTNAERLIAGLLDVREQWITWLFDVDATIQSSCDAIESLKHFLKVQVDSLLDHAVITELTNLTRHANAHGKSVTQRATAGIDSEDAFEQMRAIANLFLTKDGSWRRRFTKIEGFGPEFSAVKSRLKGILETVALKNELALALHKLRQLPNAQMDESDRALLSAVSEVLGHAVAELRLLFAQRQLIDFTELSLAARHALGQVDAPSDLLLALDQRIQHILVDEFQDTSVAQYDMLETLTAGWMPNDGRSLFLVGDPMQSIYRFRNADMSLFISARQHGVGDVTCEPLELANNFRSTPAIVEWVNDAFGQCFPEQDDLMEGVAAFRPGEATCQAERGDCVQAYALSSVELTQEHAAVLGIIEKERAEHAESHIAILVRSRSHLAGFQALLREHGWQARAVEIDAPFTSQLAQDLIGLARALTHFGDRLAWLAQLRAPWCGLEWSELEALVGDDSQITVWEAIHDEARLSRLQNDSRIRVYGMRRVFACALERRTQIPFVEWLEETWRMLGGPECTPDDFNATEVDEIFALFEQAAVDEDIADVADLESFFRQPLKQSDSANPGIDIMTIHRAKGLEFDCVILPGLARSPRGDDRRLIEWFDAFDAAGRRTRIVAPLRRGEAEAVEWIRARSRDRSRAEVARLLYVATTRARRRLHLVWGLEPDATPPDASLLKSVWPLLAHTPAAQASLPPDTDAEIFVPLRRRKQALSVPEVVTEVSPDAAAPLEPVYAWTSSTAASIGIVVHEWLQTLCEQREQVWDSAQIENYRNTFASQLELLGVPPTELSQAQEKVVQALIGVLEDARGQWIIGAREEAESEIMLSSIVNGHVVHQRLDRTFADDGVRWIVDYKTSVCHDDDVAAFLDAEVARYRPQLERYAQFMAQRDSRPIRLGLYFPMLPAFRDWPAIIAQTPVQ